MNIKQVLQNEGYEFKHYESVNSTMDKIKELFNYNMNKTPLTKDGEKKLQEELRNLKVVNFIVDLNRILENGAVLLGNDVIDNFRFRCRG